MPAPYILPHLEFRRLHGRAYRAQQRDHLEVCGALFCVASRRITLRFLKNRSSEPGRYSLDLEDVRKIRKALRGSGARFLGLFHSHPISEAVLGPRDLRNLPVRSVHMVYDVCGLSPRMWRITRVGRKKVPRELPLAVIRSPERSRS